MSKVEITSDGNALFDCPGCGFLHVVYLTTPGRPHWSFNGDREKPTFSPSILVHWTEHPLTDPVNKICHSFVREGKIEFCADSTHSLAGQTVDLPEYE